MLNFAYEYIGNILKSFISSNIIVQFVILSNHPVTPLLGGLFFSIHLPNPPFRILCEKD